MVAPITAPPANTPGDFAGNPVLFDQTKMAWYLWFQAACPQFSALATDLQAEILAAVNVAASASATAAANAVLASKVTGPASATANALAKFDGTTGKLVKVSGILEDDAGSLLVGTTISPSAGRVRIAQASSDVQLQLERTATSAGSGFIGASSVNALNVYNQSLSQVLALTQDGSLLMGATSGAMHILKKSSLGEYAARIENSGAGGANNPCGLNILYSGVSGGVGSDFVICQDASAQRFRVLGTGNVQNINNSYGALSDLKLKDNIVDVSPKLAKLLQVRIVNYTLKADPNKTKLMGVIAQELEQISSNLIEETPDFEEVTRTREVKKAVPVTEKAPVLREQKTVEVVDGKAIIKTEWLEELADVPVVDHYPLFDDAGQPVLEMVTPEVPAVTDSDGNVTQPAAAATYRQAMHSVPRMKEVTETETYTERVATGTTTKSVKYSVFVPMLIKAMQEQQAQIDTLSGRLLALGAA
jgi:hypothetical protein